MKQLLAMLALAVLVAGCNTTEEEPMGSTSSDSTTITGSETNGTSTPTNGSTINTNGTLNGTSTQP